MNIKNNNMTAKEILEVIKLHYSEDNFAYAEWLELEEESNIVIPEGLSYEQCVQHVFEQLGLGEIVEIEQYGGEEQGSTWYSIKHFVDHNIYIRTDGYYSSYHGTDFDFGYGKEVKPKEKTITVYE